MTETHGNGGTDDWYSSGDYERVAISAQGGLAAKIFHGQIERGLSKDMHLSSVLEVGALSGQHVPYVRHGFDTWTLCDIVDPPNMSFDDHRINFIKQDIHDLSFDDEQFDRVAATCVLHHLDRPMQAMEQMRRVCKKGGHLTLFLPIEPGWAYGLAMELTSIRRARKVGLEYEARRSRALGHRNHHDSLKWQLLEVFKNDRVTRHTWPLPFGGRLLNIFSSWHIIRSS